MKIASAPELADLLKDIELSDILKIYDKFRAIDDKGRYLHWSDFKRKDIDKNTDLKLAWASIKMQRHSIYKKIILADDTFYFCIPDSLQLKLHKIDKLASGHLATSDADHSKKKFLIKSLMMEEAISSAQLEGAVTTRKVAKEMLTKQTPPKNKSEQMIFNNYLLMKEALARKAEPLTSELILDLHAIATKDAIENNAIAGEYRTTDDIYIKNYDNDIIYTPPKAEQLAELIKELCDFVNTEHTQENADIFLHPVVKAILIHFFIGFIHPFGDGNGRTARALFYWFMVKSGYWLFEYISISKLLKDAPAQYAKSYLLVEDDELDTTYFIYYQVDIIIRAINELLAYIAKQQEELSSFITHLKESSKATSLNLRQLEILKKSVKEPGRLFTAKEISTEFYVSENTARTDLKELQQKGYLLEIASAKPLIYIAPADLKEKLFSK